MKQRRPTRSAITLAVLLAVGCDLPPGAAEISSPDASLRSSSSAVTQQPTVCDPAPPPKITIGPFEGCQPWNCGSNGAWLGGNIIFHELDAHGVWANSRGVKILSFQDRHGIPLTLDIVGDQLVAIQRDGTVLPDPPMDGWVLNLTVGSTPGTPGTLYDLIITKDSPDTTPFWVASSISHASAPVYLFNYKPHNSDCPLRSLCQPTTDPETISFSGRALIFTADRYDADRKTVKLPNQPDDGNALWFNIACAGTTIAKMHLLRHTVAGSAPTTPPRIERRQAVLKMLAADYCGTGSPLFTRDGHPLQYSFSPPTWANVRPPPPPPPVRSLDAIWNENGAVCLNAARLEDESADIRVPIDHECEISRHAVLKPCPASVRYDSPSSWSPLGYAISANEFPPR
jgi:hypothetical protein